MIKIIRLIMIGIYVNIDISAKQTRFFHGISFPSVSLQQFPVPLFNPRASLASSPGAWRKSISSSLLLSHLHVTPFCHLGRTFLLAGWAPVKKPDRLCRNLGCSDSKLPITSLPDIFKGNMQKDIL